ncbi:RNA polymerase sigma factor [Kordiimonas pumila]|uniref:RNA polymerase sigma factor n=1 Tax=Kordiimonas pumila TaxID=2161677 RepID=A0ABV7D4X4_9PROT|nr:RNA polymerase sigma factor [Kordiimonas pumila]
MSKIYKAFQANEKAIKRVFARYFRTSEDIEDLAQETFIKCFAAEARHDINDARSFLFRAAKNLAYSERKKMFRLTTDYVEDAGGADTIVDEMELSPEKRLDSQRKLALLVEAVASLPDEYREAFLMRKMENLKLSQIATRTNVTVRTAQNRVASALDMCDAHLRRRGYSPEEFGRMPELKGLQGVSPIGIKNADGKPPLYVVDNEGVNKDD